MGKLIGKTVTIENEESMYYGEWGIIKHYDGEYYHIAIANDTNMLVIFDGNEFSVRSDIDAKRCT